MLPNKDTDGKNNSIKNQHVSPYKMKITMI